MSGEIANRSQVLNSSLVLTPHILIQPTLQKNPWYKRNVDETQLRCQCSYGVAFKLNVVECTGKKSKEAAAREFGVATKSI